MGKTLPPAIELLDPDKLADICRRYDVGELALFGSAVRGEMQPNSDLDILVEFAATARIGLVKFGALSDELEALAGRRVDLVTRTGLKPWIRPHILKEARVIYAA